MNVEAESKFYKIPERGVEPQPQAGLPRGPTELAERGPQIGGCPPGSESCFIGRVGPRVLKGPLKGSVEGPGPTASGALLGV